MPDLGRHVKRGKIGGGVQPPPGQARADPSRPGQVTQPRRGESCPRPGHGGEGIAPAREHRRGVDAHAQRFETRGCGRRVGVVGEGRPMPQGGSIQPLAHARKGRCGEHHGDDPSAVAQPGEFIRHCAGLFDGFAGAFDPGGVAKVGGGNPQIQPGAGKFEAAQEGREVAPGGSFEFAGAQAGGRDIDLNRAKPRPGRPSHSLPRPGSGERGEGETEAFTVQHIVL